MCANEYAYQGKLCAQMNHILSKMCANVLPPNQMAILQLFALHEKIDLGTIVKVLQTY